MHRFYATAIWNIKFSSETPFILSKNLLISLKYDSPSTWFSTFFFQLLLLMNIAIFYHFTMFFFFYFWFFQISDCSTNSVQKYLYQNHLQKNEKDSFPFYYQNTIVTWVAHKLSAWQKWLKEKPSKRSSMIWKKLMSAFGLNLPLVTILELKYIGEKKLTWFVIKTGKTRN